MWCIPPEQDAAFVAHMEQVLEVYKRPYNARRPVVCMDEQSKQLISECVAPQSMTPGHPLRIDHEYVREGQCTVWMFVEPLAGWRSVRTSDRRTGVDWACQVQQLVNDRRYALAERITVVCDNLNTHNLGSLYQAFEPAEALRIARKVELVYTPKHGSWLNAAEPELSALTRQCLDRRIPTRLEVGQQARIWKNCRNRNHIGVDWQFTTDNARIKLRHLYPKMLN
jgi:hypothetical protein